MKEFKYEVTVRVADDIAKKYPNYKTNHESEEDFADSIIMEASVDHLKEFGFSMTVDKQDEIPTDLNTNEYKQLLKDLGPRTKGYVALALNLYSHLTGAPASTLSCIHKDAKSQKCLSQLIDTMDELKALVKEKE